MSLRTPTIVVQEIFEIQPSLFILRLLPGTLKTSARLQLPGLTFGIKSVKGANDFFLLREKVCWPLPRLCRRAVGMPKRRGEPKEPCQRPNLMAVLHGGCQKVFWEILTAASPHLFFVCDLSCNGLLTCMSVKREIQPTFILLLF